MEIHPGWYNVSRETPLAALPRLVTATSRRFYQMHARVSFLRPRVRARKAADRRMQGANHAATVALRIAARKGKEEG